MLDANPFARLGDTDDPSSNPAFDKSLRNVIDRIAGAEPLIPVFGEPGTGKTLLLAEIERRLRTRGSVRRLQRGDEIGDVANLPQLLLVDEGDRADPEAIEKVFAGGWTGTLVLACARDCVARLPASRRSRPERLRPLRAGEARAFARARLARAGQSGLVAPKALEELARASQGNVRAIVQIGGAAVFFAREAGSSLVRAEHVRAAVEMRRSLDARPPAPERRSRVRLWRAAPGVLTSARHRRTELLAGTGAVFALVLLMLGGIKTSAPTTETRLGSPAATNASIKKPRSTALTTLQAEPVAPGITVQASSQERPPLLADNAAIGPTIVSEPTRNPVFEPKGARAATAPSLPIAQRSSRPAAQRAPVSTELAVAEAIPAPPRPEQFPHSQSNEAVRSTDAPAMLAINLPSAPQGTSPTLSVDADQPVEADKQTRKKAMKALDAMREMRIARGG